MTSQPGNQAIAIHTLSDTLKSKGNQTMMFDKFKEYDLRSIF